MNLPIDHPRRIIASHRTRVSANENHSRNVSGPLPVTNRPPLRQSAIALHWFVRRKTASGQERFAWELPNSSTSTFERGYPQKH